MHEQASLNHALRCKIAEQSHARRARDRPFLKWRPYSRVPGDGRSFCILMAIPIMQSRYHPKNWHMVTWMCVLYWGAWAGLTNWPHKIDPKTVLSAYNESAVNHNLPIYTTMHGQLGFPSNYSSFVFDSSQILAETFSLNALIFNCFLTGIALVSIVILGQSIKYFSIVHLLAITAGIALMLGIYTSIKPGYPVNYLCEVTIFAAPPAILVATTIIRKMQNKKLQPSARSTVVTCVESPTRTG